MAFARQDPAVPRPILEGGRHCGKPPFRGTANTVIANTVISKKMDNLRMLTANPTTQPARSRWRWGLLALLLSAALILGACSDTADKDSQAACDALLDDANWDSAITTCGAIDTDEGRSKTMQAYMGRAGITLIDLFGSLDSNLDGLALMLSVFTVERGSAEYDDIISAITISDTITAPTDSDYFNIVVATDVIITTLLVDELNMSLDTAGAVVIPGVTDSGLETLTSTSTTTEVQDIFEAIYTTVGSYYQTTPPVWDDTDADITDLVLISQFVSAGVTAAVALDLDTSLPELNMGSDLDNGVCGLDTTVTASGADNTTDGPLVALSFPRRMNTSHSTGIYLLDDLYFTYGDLSAGTADATKEWGGAFLLPSRLVNPSHFGVACFDTVALNHFADCTAAATLNAGISQITLSDLTTDITCGAGSCSNFPLLNIDGDPTSDDTTTEGDTAKTELAEVLHQLWPVDNDDTDPDTTGLHCIAGDGLVHPREYDYYLRSFGAE